MNKTARICNALKIMQPSFFENLGSIGHNNIAVIVQKENELKDLFGRVFFFFFPSF